MGVSSRLALTCLGGLAIWSVSGPALADSHSNEQGNNTMPAFEIQEMVNGSFETIGTITFDDKNNGTLTLSASGPSATKLEDAWSGISGQDLIRLKRSARVKDENGNQIRKLMSVEVERASEDFPQASVEYLSNKFGFFGRPAN